MWATRHQLWTCIKIITNDHHWCITACSLALNLDDGELSILGRLAWLNSANMFADRGQNVCGAAQHARRCCANLDKIRANWISTYINVQCAFHSAEHYTQPVEHCVECCYFIHTHRRYL
jgi:hypothetical protein